MNKSIQSGCSINTGIKTIYDENMKTIKFDMSEYVSRILTNIYEQIDNIALENLTIETLEKLKNKVDEEWNKRIKGIK